MAETINKPPEISIPVSVLIKVVVPIVSVITLAAVGHYRIGEVEKKCNELDTDGSKALIAVKEQMNVKIAAQEKYIELLNKDYSNLSTKFSDSLTRIEKSLDEIKKDQKESNTKIEKIVKP